ncbi:MAG: hypothetical protein M3Y51_05275, partial [Actinomycetota bacterium]|nr:hypothetical protein [Actinomycetota bacterium]
MADEHTTPEPLGPNAWLVEEMYEQYRNDPGSVSDSWREFFADYRPPGRSSAQSSAAPGAGVTAPPSA